MGRAQRKEFHSSDIAIDQKPDIDLSLNATLGRDEIVQADAMPTLDYAEELKFMEDPVTIRISQSSEKNAYNRFPVSVNGKGGEILVKGKWVELGWLPLGTTLVTKRKYLEVILRSKVDRVETVVEGELSERPLNKVSRFTSQVHIATILRDDNPRGAEWASEVIRRNM